MKMRPKCIAVLLSGISLLLATSTAQAGNSFFSFSFGYSSHGHYISPYRFVYAPAYIHVAPSPFFFGYTSYYYPVFPYYYTPVVYYRPFLPYRYPYAYYPHRHHHWNYHAYRHIYPRTYFYGHFAHNYYYKHKPYYHYNYSQSHHYAKYKYQPRKHQHSGFNTRNLVINSPSANTLVRHAPATRNIQSVTINNTTAREQQRARELERYRSALQRRHHNQGAERSNDSRPVWNERRSFANTDTQSVMQQRRNDHVRERLDNRNLRTEQSAQTDQTANNRRIERLINRNNGTSRPDLERNNRLNQQRSAVNQQHQRRMQANLGNTRVINSSVENRQINQQRPPRNNLARPDNSSFRQQPAAAERNRQFDQRRQLTQQRPARNNQERSNIVNSSRQPVAAERKRQFNQKQLTQQRPVRNNQERVSNINSKRQSVAAGNISQGKQRSEVISQRKEPSGKISTRGGNNMSLRQGGISQRSAGGAGFRR
jgi:hypothetical protein